MEDVHFARAVGSMGSEWAEKIFSRFESKFAKEEAEEIAQMTIKGTGKGFVKAGDTIMEDKLGAVIKAGKRAGYGNLVEEGGEERLELLIKNETHGGVKIGGETIDGVTRLTKGEIPPGEDGWGWIKIREKHILGHLVNGKAGTTFKQVYGIEDEQIIKTWIDESISRYSSSSNRFLKRSSEGFSDRFEYWYFPIKGKPPIITIVDNGGFFKGKIVTSYPEPNSGAWPNELIQY